MKKPNFTLSQNYKNTGAKKPPKNSHYSQWRAIITKLKLRHFATLQKITYCASKRYAFTLATLFVAALRHFLSQTHKDKHLNIKHITFIMSQNVAKVFAETPP